MAYPSVFPSKSYHLHTHHRDCYIKNRYNWSKNRLLLSCPFSILFKTILELLNGNVLFYSKAREKSEIQYWWRSTKENLAVPLIGRYSHKKQPIGRTTRIFIVLRHPGEIFSSNLSRGYCREFNMSAWRETYVFWWSTPLYKMNSPHQRRKVAGQSLDSFVCSWWLLNEQHVHHIQTQCWVKLHWPVDISSCFSHPNTEPVMQQQLATVPTSHQVFE